MRPSTSRRCALALGVERLDYLGFSYGTALGAVYAMAHPDRVGRFVLDGAIAPDAGDPDGPYAGHMPDYAADELDAVVARFHELCAATTECAAGPDSAALVADLATTIDTLPTDHFDGEPEQLISFDIDQLVEGATYDPYSFGLLGDALRDAADGDASTLAALVSYLIAPVPRRAGRRRGGDQRGVLRRPLRRLQRCHRGLGLRGDAAGRRPAGDRRRSTSPRRSS